MNTVWHAHPEWVAVAGSIGFLISFIFARLLHPPRNVYLIPCP